MGKKQILTRRQRRERLAGRFQGEVDVGFGVGGREEHVVARVQVGAVLQRLDGEEVALRAVGIVVEQVRILQFHHRRAGTGRRDDRLRPRENSDRVPGQVRRQGMKSAIELGLVTSEQFDEWVRPEKMVGNL